MTLSLIDFIGHASMGLIAISFFAKDNLFLRGLSILACLVGIAYNYFIPVGPIWIPIFWNILFIGINLYRIIGIILERRGVNLNDKELELFETIFKGFSPVEFMKLMRISSWQTVEANYHMIEQGTHLKGLYLLFNGEVIIKQDDVEIARSKDGSLIGEISFIRGGEATATVITACPSEYVYWAGDDLKKLLLRNPNMDIAMKQVFSMELSKKLLR